MRKITIYAYEIYFQKPARSAFVPNSPQSNLSISVFKNQQPGVLEQATACTITAGFQT